MAAKTQVQVLVGVILFIKKLCFLWVRIRNHSLQPIHHLSLSARAWCSQVSIGFLILTLNFITRFESRLTQKNFFLLSFFSKSQRVTQRLRLKVTLRHLEKTKMAVLEKKPSRSKMAALEKKPSRSKMAALEKKPSRSKMVANLNKKLYQKKNQNPKNPTWRT